jgi:hypothetical protein
LDIVVFTLIDNFQYQHQFIYTENIAHQDKTFMVYGVLCHFQQYFSYIVAVSFIGGGNRSTWRKENHRPVASH